MVTAIEDLITANLWIYGIFSKQPVIGTVVRFGVVYKQLCLAS